MSRPAELRRGRRLSAAPSRQAETRTSWISQKGTTVSPQRIALEKAYQTDKDELLNMTLSSLVQMNEDPMSKFVERRFDTEDVIAAIERNQSNLHGDGISVDIGELINENPTAILGSIGKELKKDSIKRKMESDMKAFTASRHHSLVENIKKKADASKQRDSNLEVVITNLVNDEKRDKLLDVSMMKEMHMDYLYKKETRLLEQGLGNNKKAQKGALRSQNQNEDLIVSKHIRKNPFSLQLDTGISNKLYYMNIEKKKKKMAFIRMAMEVYKQKNSLLDRRKTNSEVIEYLLSFQKAENNTKNSKEFQCLAMLRRIYIRQSHRDIVANQNKMNKQEFKEVFKKLKLYPDYIALAKIDEIFLETTQGTGKNTIDTLEFLECMRRAAESIYEAIEESDTESSNSQTEDLLLFKLYDRFIHKEMFQFNLPHHEKLNKPTIQQYIFKQDPIIKFLFTSFTKSTDDDVRPFEDPKEPMISFEQIFEMFTLTGLFPHHCEKLQIRFYFDYVAPTEFGLDYEDFKVFIPLIGMDIIDRANKINLHEHLKMKLDPAELQLPKEPLEMLRTFFKSSKYIGSMRVLKQKIMMNENKHRVMDLTAKKTFYNMAKFNKTLLNYMDS